VPQIEKMRGVMSSGYVDLRIQRCAVVALLAALVLSFAPALQASPQELGGDMVIQEAAGRVVFWVAKDAIILAATDQGPEAGTRPPAGLPPRMPAVAPLGAGRVAVLLGAVDWTREGADKTTHLDAELPGLVQQVVRAATRADQLDQATDVESIGVILLEFLRPLAGSIHHKLDLAASEPLVELLLAAYTEGYGPEVWSLHYRVQQRNLGNDYWDTRPLRPAYYQLYPPERGQPQTFVEAQYPPKAAPLGLLRAAQSDAAVARIRTSSEEINKAVTEILNGQSRKADTRPATEFLRAAIPALAGGQAKLAIATVDQQYRFQWVLAPEDAPPAPSESQPDARPPEPERPSLRRAAPPAR
jgi:hypothetical protein